MVNISLIAWFLPFLHSRGIQSQARYILVDLITYRSGPEVVTTPLLSHGDTHSLYFLELQGISVGAKNIPVDSDDDHAQTFKGNIVIDSGTLLTFLPEELYGRFETAIREALYDQVVKQDPAGNLGLCFLTYDRSSWPCCYFPFQWGRCEA